MGSRGRDDGVESAPTVAAGSVGLEATVASVDAVGHTTPSPPALGQASAATVASFDHGLTGLTPERLVQVQAGMYERLDELARGGLGKISRARDVRSGRIVAIKEVITQSDDGAIRFAREAMITANLQHPAIVPVYEVGRWPSGEPFYAMKLVRGRPLDQVIHDTTDLDQRLALTSHVLAVADALAYAHGEHVIHRDLKPHNVLCGAFGETVVIDWGLARRIEEEETTQSLHRRTSAAPGQTYVGAIMGTPAYMPPEQARGKRVDERADVYAIGAILYHVLTGAPPYAGKTLDELIEKVKAGPPRRLVDVVPEVPADLAAIAERAMAPDPAARYPSAAELATDLRRFTTGQLVLAHRYTAVQRVSRYVRKHRGPVMVTALALVALVVGGGFALGSVFRARDHAELAQARAESEQRRADAERDEARNRLIAAHSDRARVELVAQHPQTALAFITAAADVGGIDPTLRYLAARALEGIPSGHRFVEPELGSLAFVPGSHDLLIADPHQIVRWNPDTDQRVWESAGTTADLEPVATGQFLTPRPHSLAVFDTATGKQMREIEVSPTIELAGLLAFDRTNRWVAAVSTTGLELFDLTAGTHVRSIPVGGRSLVPVISPDGQRMVVGLPVSDGVTRMVLVDSTGRELRELCGNCRIVRDVGPGFATSDFRGGLPPHVVFYDWSGKQLEELVPGTVSEVDEIVATRDQRLVALLTADGMIEVHELGKGLRWRRTIQDRAYNAQFDAFGRLWILGSYAGVHLFDSTTGDELDHWALGGAALRVSDDGKQVAIGSLQTGVASWPIAKTMIESFAPSAERVRRLLFSGDRVITASDDGGLHVFEPGKPVRELGRHTQRVLSLQRIPGEAVMSSSRDDTTVIREIATGKVLETYPLGLHAEVSPDGTHLAIGTKDGAVTVIDRASKVSRVFARLSTEVASVRWSPDGTKLAAIDNNSQVVVWSTDGTKLRELPPGLSGLDLVFSHDGRWLGVVQLTRQLVLLSLTPGVPDHNLETAARVETLATNVSFSPDDSRVAIAEQGRIRIWTLATGVLETTLLPGSDVIGMTFSRDGTLLYTGGTDHKIRVWDAARGMAQIEIAANGEIYGLAFNDVGPERLAVLTLGPAVVWNLNETSFDLPKLRQIVACNVAVDPVTGASHVIDVPACNRLATP